MFEMLHNLFERAERDCDTSIRFLPDEHGNQTNEVRDLICALLRRNDIRRGNSLAKRLCECTTAKSGLGLLFFLIGRQEGQTTSHKLVISRFPADQGILANEVGSGLSIQFVERIFMKNKATYKAALYTGTSLDGGFWRGRAVDKQFKGTIDQGIANYWVNEFLKSDLRTTPAEGTRRFAIALRAANRDADNLDLKEEIIAISKLARRINEALSVNERLMRLHASQPVQKLVRKHLPGGNIADDRFRLDTEEYDRHIKYRSVSLDNGAIITALADEFDQCFSRQEIGSQRVRFATEGKVTDDRLRKTGR